MAQSSLRQDSCSYMEQLRRSTGPGMYMLATPGNDCAPCGRDIPADPYLRWQSWGPGFCQPGENVDVGSELLGLPYRNSKCSTDQYLPSKYQATTRGIATPCKAAGAQAPRACMAPTEDTRLSNPPCTLKGTGWNRWEWLCEDPQERALIPFEWNTSYRIVAKDNHTPCIPKLVDESVFQPGAKAAAPAPPATQTIHDWKAPEGCGASAPGTPYAPTWQKCRAVPQM